MPKKQNGWPGGVVPKPNFDRMLSHFAPVALDNQSLNALAERMVQRGMGYEEAQKLIDYLITKRNDPSWKWPRGTNFGEAKISLKSLLSEHVTGDPMAHYGADDIQVGDKVDVYLPDSFMSGETAVRVLELVDDVNEATGTLASDEDAAPGEQYYDFEGPGFVGDSEDEGEMVFSLHQVVPGSKEKYEAMMADDPYASQKNYDADNERDYNLGSISDYYDDNDKKQPTTWRAAPWGEGKTMKLTDLLDETFMKSPGKGTQPEPVTPEQAQKLLRMQVRTVDDIMSSLSPGQFKWLQKLDYPTVITALHAVAAGQEESPVVDDMADAEGPSARTAPSGRQFEGFDKFMDRISLQESHAANRKLMVVEDSPMRQRAMKHQERPAGRVVFKKR